MQIELEANQLRDALNKILGVIEKKSSRPILTYCLIRACENSIEILSSDLDISTKVVLDAQVDNAGEFCINAKNISDILHELPNEKIYLAIDDDRNNLKLKCGSIKYSLLICSTDEFPPLHFAEDASDKFTVTSEQMLEFITKTYYAIPPSNDTRVYLNGIFLHEIEDKIRAVATDGYKLALIENQELVNKNTFLKDGIIIPRKGVYELKKIADSSPGDFLDISVDESFIYVNCASKYFLAIRLIAREYPPYQAVIPSKTLYYMRVNRDMLLNAVRRIKILANEKSYGIRFKLEENKLAITANHPSLGDASELVEVEYSGKEMEIGLNAKYLIDTFSIFDDSEITFEFNNEISPIIVKSPKIPSFLGIIMPLNKI